LAAAFTGQEVRKALSRMANDKAPGHDGVPAELLKCSGATGLHVITHTLNIVFAAERIPLGWREGVVVSLHKAGDATECVNYRGLTLLPALNKLFCLLLAARLGATVPLHDQQYAFRKRRGTLNALFNLSNVVRERIKAKLPTFAFFLDAEKAYDSVDHDALLDRLVAKGVTGRAWRVVDQLYAGAASGARVDGVPSDPFPVLRGVAQGCPLVPFLYEIFIDSLLESVHAECAADGIQIGKEGTAAHMPWLSKDTLMT
jgi:Reverse transcriptase (RNA-dependent DNA polymerase)